MFFLNVSDSESNGSVMIQAQFKTHGARALVINYAIFEMRTNSANELHGINAAERSH